MKASTWHQRAGSGHRSAPGLPLQANCHVKTARRTLTCWNGAQPKIQWFSVKALSFRMAAEIRRFAEELGVVFDDESLQHAVEQVAAPSKDSVKQYLLNNDLKKIGAESRWPNSLNGVAKSIVRPLIY